MNEELKKEAEALIEKYFKIVFNGHNKIQDDFEYGMAKKSAQLECQSIIKELELMESKFHGGIEKNTYPYKHLQSRITHYQSLIKQIEIQ